MSVDFPSLVDLVWIIVKGRLMEIYGLKEHLRNNIMKETAEKIHIISLYP